MIEFCIRMTLTTVVLLLVNALQIGTASMFNDQTVSANLATIYRNGKGY